MMKHFPRHPFWLVLISVCTTFTGPWAWAGTSTGEYRVSVNPMLPTSNDAITIQISDTWTDSCAPGEPVTYRLSGNNTVDIIATPVPPGSVCTFALRQYTIEKMIGKLPPGSYTVRYFEGAAEVSGPPNTFTVTSAAVTPGRAQADLAYVAVDPCRIVDTRLAGGAIRANTARNFQVSGTAQELAVQGGNFDCLDPKAGTGVKPSAISAYVIAVPASSSTGPGVLTAYPSDQPPPAVGAGSTVNFDAGQIIGNTTNITLCNEDIQGFSCPASGELAILSRFTDEHVVIDVQGYFYPQLERSEGHIDGVTGSPVPNFASRGTWTSERVNVGVYTITIPDLLEETPTGCGPKTTLPNPVVSVWNTGLVNTFATAFINGVGANCGTLEWFFYVRTVIDGVTADSDFTFQF